MTQSHQPPLAADQAVSHEPTPQSFVAPTNRDAWATIRGFVYQADLTIERWLSLEPNQELQLECGEDIDTVTQYLEGRADARLLEQVKHRETNVTLKSGGALGALANAVGHRHDNPGLPLIFRYTTNADAAKERLSPFAGSQSGITAWSRLRLSELGAEPLSAAPDEASKEAARLLNGIRQILRGAQTFPSDLNETTWTRFREFVETAHDAEVLSLIRAFEWSTGTTSAEEMSDRIQQILLEQGRASGPTEAFGQYQRLFLHVLKTLAIREGKRLTAAEISEIVALPLNENDRAFFDNFLEQMGLLTQKLTFLQAQMSCQGRQVERIAAQIGRLHEFGRLQALTLQVPLPIFEPPPVGDHLSSRTETVGRLKHDLDQSVWLALTGSSGTGKSHLALLLAVRYTNCPMWLRFRDLSSDRAAAMLDSVLLHFAGGSIAPSHRELYTAACRNLGSNALIVLDDLPDLLAGDSLAQRLELLVPACAEVGVKLVTTSVNRMPGSLRRATRGLLCETEVPPLTEVEALEILQSFGAPLGLLGDLPKVRFINSVSRCHPALLTAVALYLSGQNWEWTDQQFDDLLLGRYAGEINEETIRRLLVTVTDNAARELLYRLNLVLGPFDIETVRALASVEPSIPVPRERLVRLTGLWIQRDVGDLMRVSPLVSLLGNDDLPETVRHDGRVALAEALLQSGSLGPYDMQNVVTYLAGAHEHERAAAFLAWALSQMYAAIERGEISSYLAQKIGMDSIFWDAPLPVNVSLNTRLLLRVQQIRVGEALGKDLSAPLADLVAAVDAAGDDEAACLLLAAVTSSLVLARLDFDASCRCLTKALCASPNAKLPDGSPLELPSEFPLSSLLWWNLTGIRGKKEVLRWCDMLARVPEEMRRQALMDPDFSLRGASLLMDRLWLTEAIRSSEDQNWPALLQDLEEIEARARGIGVPFLIGATARAKVIVLCERMQDPDSGVTTAQRVLEEFPDDLRIRFMLCDAVGRKLSYLPDRTQEAQEWLERADAAGDAMPEELELERAMALLAMARLADGRGRAGEAARLVSRAVALIRDASDCPEIELVKLLGELALAEWKQENREGAFAALDDAIPRLLTLRKDTSEEKALFTLFGHTTGYMASCTSFGHPLEVDDSEPSVLPPLGNFHDMKEAALAAHHQGERDLLMPVLMVQFALVVGRDDRVAFWADKAVEMGQLVTASSSVTSGMMLSTLPHLLQGRRMAEFFNGAREATFILIAELTLYRVGERDFVFRELDIEAVLGGRGSTDWDEAERHALMFTLVPLAVFLARLAIEARADANTADQLRAATMQAVSLCHEVAAVSTRAEDWREAARLIEECYARNPVMEGVVRRANQYPEDKLPLKALAYIGATLELALDPKQALTGQMAVLPYCLKCFFLPGFYRLLLLPYVEAFWGWQVANRRLCFSPPAAGANGFAEASAVPVSERAKRIMRTMALALGKRGDSVVEDGFRSWDAIDAQTQGARGGGAADR